MIQQPRFYRATLIAIILFSLWCGSALANGGASFGLRPERYDPARPETESYFIYDAAPGQHFEDEVHLWNSGTEAGTVRLYVVDATTGQTSGAVYLGSDKPREDVGSWITLDEQEVTLAPGEERTIGFAVSIPADAQPGQHLGGLVAENIVLQEGAQEGALRVNVQTRTVTAVQVNLPGERVEKVEILDITSNIEQGLQTMVVSLRNAGTEMVKPTGELVVTDAQGNEIQRLPLQLDTFLPRSEIQYPVYVQGQALPEGQYHASLTLKYGTGTEANYDRTFEVSAAQIQQLYEAVQQQLPQAASESASQENGTEAAVAPAAGSLSMGMLAVIVLSTLLSALVTALVVLRLTRSTGKKQEA